jgi:hypothetical protein
MENDAIIRLKLIRQNLTANFTKNRPLFEQFRRVRGS